MPRKRRSYPAELKAKVRWTLREEATMAELAARDDVHPNLIANWKKTARQTVLAGFSTSGASRPRSRSCGHRRTRHPGFFIEGLRSVSRSRESRWLPTTHGSASYGCRLVSIARSC